MREKEKLKFRERHDELIKSSFTVLNQSTFTLNRRKNITDLLVCVPVFVFAGESVCLFLRAQRRRLCAYSKMQGSDCERALVFAYIFQEKL